MCEGAPIFTSIRGWTRIRLPSSIPSGAGSGIIRNPAYRLALKRGRRAEIPLVDIRKSFVAAVAKSEAPALTQIVKPKVLRTQDGRAVAAASWKPREVKGK
jgi:hypothetical protein